MKEEISVDDALKKGFWFVKIPMYIILMSTFILKSVYFKTVFDKTTDSVICVIIGLLLCWIYRRLTIPIWENWAYNNVENVNELKNKALKKGLIFSGNGFFEKTEINSFQQKEKLKQLEKKTLKDDTFQGDLNLSNETKIYYSKIKLSLSLLLSLTIMTLFVYFISSHISFKKLDSSYIYYALFLLLFSYFIYITLKNLLNNNPQITISEKGIQIKDEPICLWKDIESDFVYDKWTGRLNHNKYLSYNNIDILINDYNINMKELENLLHIYRTRYEKSNFI